MEEPYQYRPALFFLLAYAGAWIPWFFGVYLGSVPELKAYASLLSLGLLGPIGAALALVFASGSEALKSDFKDRLFDLRRIRPIFAVAATVMPFAVICLSVVLSLAFGQSKDQFSFAGGGSLLAMIVLAMVLAPIMEEVGWHGYGVDSLRAKNGVLKATLLFGLLWSAWHAPLFLIDGTYQSALARMGNPFFVANFFVSVIPAAIIANWFLLPERPLDRVGSLPAFHAQRSLSAVECRTGGEVHCDAALRGDRRGAHRCRPRALR